jgi:predicted ATP-dependent Lon-type protease
LGEVCQILVKDNPDLRGKGGCWCIITQVGDRSCTVATWDGVYTLKLEHLKPLNYPDMDCEQMNSVCVHEVTPKEYRLTRLRNSGKLEQAATSLLQHIGQVKRPYLTPLEEKLLSVLEQEYGVETGQSK